jgi:hypothetical protein
LVVEGDGVELVGAGVLVVGVECLIETLRGIRDIAF